MKEEEEEDGVPLVEGEEEGKIVEEDLPLHVNETDRRVWERRKIVKTLTTTQAAATP